MTNNIPQEEKIDYIYSILKKNERKALFATFIKWGFRIFILGYLYYFITIGLPAMVGNMIPSIPSGLSSEGLNINPSNIKNTLGELFSK